MTIKCFLFLWTHARAGGGAFPAVGDVGLVGVVGVAQQRAGGWSPAAARGGGFTQLDSTFLLGAVLGRGGLTPLWMRHPWRDVLTDYDEEKTDTEVWRVSQRCCLHLWQKDVLNKVFLSKMRRPTFEEYLTLT